MAAGLWTSVLSLVGVLVGGGLTAFTQRATQRAAERSELRRQRLATAEARRAELIQAIKEFTVHAQEAERAAYSRPDPWGDDEGGWMTETQAVMAKLWAADRTLALLSDPVLHAPLHDYGRALNQAVWRDTSDQEVNAHLEPHKTAFMVAARASLAAQQPAD
ncbi:hypothetical protein [Pseudonocardia lacus]|uniref:hypothetical protein n=1 Tax=Pseudonocardia lacus TaxID=2835865 RepID=UPI001BDD969D|nr:hypothetical protein [Pseudonocardia lacus]